MLGLSLQVSAPVAPNCASSPDVLTFGAHVLGLSLQGGCRALSGTSVACPVVAGAIALLASIVPEPRRWQLLNPGAIKQVLVESAHRLHRRSAYEQGAGTMDLLGAAQVRALPIASTDGL